MTRKKFLAAAASLAATVVATRAALAQTPPPQNPSQGQPRPQGASNHSLVEVHRGLERLIDRLQRDDHDYGGYRVKAIQSMQQAREDIDAAIKYERQHQQGQPQGQHPYQPNQP